MKNIFPIAISLALAASCSKSGGGGGSVGPQSGQTQNEVQVDQEFNGSYLAVFDVINQKVSDRVMGSFTLVREADEIVADVRFSGGAYTSGIAHFQAVYEGSRCPGAQDDLNGDGFIDSKEGQTVYGKVLIPLDADINSQYRELGTYPVADAYGNYFYSQVASYTKLMEDLIEPDINPNDYLGKLGAGDKLKADGLVVVVHGVGLAAPLPSTVESNTRGLPSQTLPVACGVIRKLDGTPGTIDHDEPTPPNDSKPGGVAGTDDGADIPLPPETPALENDFGSL